MTAHETDEPDETDEIGRRIRVAADGVSAPLALRERVPQPPARGTGPTRIQLATIGATLAIIATMAAVFAPDGPSVTRIAAVSLAAPERDAPAGSDYLPGFQAVGERTDTVEGRDTATVIYERDGVGVHYTVVDGKPLDLPEGRTAEAGDLDLQLVSDGDVSIVAWHQYGKTCVLASRSASPDELAEALRSRT